MLSTVPENKDHSSMGSPNLIDIGNSLLGPLDLDQIPSKDFSGPGRIYEPNIPQTGVSASPFPEMRKLDRWESKRHYKRKTAESRLLFRSTGFPSESIDSSGFSTGRFFSLPIEGPLEGSTDLQSNDGTGGSIELLEVTSGSAESKGNEPFNRHIISNDLSRRKQLLSGNSAKSHPRIGSRFNEKVSNLNNSADNNAAVLVIAEDTNDTQPEVQKFLTEANQESRPPKAGSSRNSPSRKVSTTWEHTFVVPKKFTEAASESPPERTSRNLGRRRRPLSEDVRKRAKEMRKTRSCLRCKVSKIAVCYKIWPKGIIC